MGLQGQFSDVSSDSIPLMLIAILATFFRYIRSLLLRFSTVSVDNDASASVISIGLSDQLNQNRLFSYRYGDNTTTDCIVCLSTLKSGEEVRKLDCSHVFHKGCLEGWLKHLNFSCPLCRSPLQGHDHGDDVMSSSLSQRVFSGI